MGTLTPKGKEKVAQLKRKGNWIFYPLLIIAGLGIIASYFSPINSGPAGLLGVFLVALVEGIILVWASVALYAPTDNILAPSERWGVPISPKEAERMRHLSDEDRKEEIIAIRTDASKYIENTDDHRDLDAYMQLVEVFYAHPRAGAKFPLPREIIIAQGQIVDQH